MKFLGGGGGASGAPLAHTHAGGAQGDNLAEAVITGLVADLGGKAASSHTHPSTEITDFATQVQTATLIAAKAPVRNLVSKQTGDYTWSEACDSIWMSNGVLVKEFTAIAVSGDLDVSGAGGLDAGVKAAAILYYRFLIGKADGTVAALVSTSLTAPTLPAGYTYFRCVGYLPNGVDGKIVPYYQDNKLLWLTDWDSANHPSYVIARNTDIGATTSVAVNTARGWPVIVPTLSKKIHCLVSLRGAGDRDLGIGWTNYEWLQYFYIGSTLGLENTVDIQTDGSGTIKLSTNNQGAYYGLWVLGQYIDIV